MLSSGLTEEVLDCEVAARAIVSSTWVAKTTGRVKYPAFLPNQDHETSITRALKLSPDQLWASAQAAAGNRNLHGIGNAHVGRIRIEHLDVTSSEPPDFHADIVRWPIDPDPDLQRAKRNAVAGNIAEDAWFTPLP
jgi:hypothetical protein